MSLGATRKARHAAGLFCSHGEVDYYVVGVINNYYLYKK